MGSDARDKMPYRRPFLVQLSMPQNPADGAGTAPVVLSERSIEGKIRYASEKLTEIHDQLADPATRDQRGMLLGLAMQLDWAADAVKAQETENARLQGELRKAKRAANLLAADHRAVERVEAVLAEYRDDPYAAFLAGSIRTALDGDAA